MTRKEAIAALRRGEMSPEMFASHFLTRKRGRPSKWDAELNRAMERIEKVETLWAKFGKGNQPQAFEALALEWGVDAVTAERYYRRDKRLMKLVDELMEKVERSTALTGRYPIKNE